MKKVKEKMIQLILNKKIRLISIKKIKDKKIFQLENKL